MSALAAPRRSLEVLLNPGDAQCFDPPRQLPIPVAPTGRVIGPRVIVWADVQRYPSPLHLWREAREHELRIHLPPMQAGAARALAGSQPVLEVVMLHPRCAELNLLRETCPSHQHRRGETCIGAFASYARALGDTDAQTIPQEPCAPPQSAWYAGVVVRWHRAQLLDSST